MDGRLVTALLTLVLPAGLLGLTIYRFASNPVSVLVLVAVMCGGAFYLLTYHETFA